MTRIAVAQYQIENLASWDAYKEKIVGIVEKAKNQNAELLLFSEYAGIECASFHASDALLYQTLQSLLPNYCMLYQELAKKYQIYIQPGTILVEAQAGKYVNRAFLFGPNGRFHYQDKLQLTEFEKATNLIIPGTEQTIFDTALGKIGIAICYDSEFPEIVRRLTLAGAWLILVPSYTVDEAGYYRVSISSRARALENQCYVATSFTVGKIEISHPEENAVGQSAIFGPIESALTTDGIVNQSLQKGTDLVFATISLEQSNMVRLHGQVHNFHDLKNLDKLFQTSIPIFQN